MGVLNNEIGVCFRIKTVKCHTKYNKDEGGNLVKIFRNKRKVNNKGITLIALVNKIFGDATIETSTAGKGTTSWNSAGSYFVGISLDSYYPFFTRGGYYYYNSESGSFCFVRKNGNSNSDDGFRVCLAVQ